MKDGGVGGEIGWPEDTVIVSYHGDTGLLMDVVLSLSTADFIFVVSPKHKVVAMSRDAAMLLGIWKVG